MPYRFASFPESIVGQSIEPFGPATMQFNSLTVKDTDEASKNNSLDKRKYTNKRNNCWGETLEGMDGNKIARRQGICV